MNEMWSKYIQTTEELYQSRDLRFNDSNKETWINAIGAKQGDNILEIGCAGGTFCHKIKKYIENVNITGIDFDSGHIKFAKEKSKELGLSCNFVNADATDLPFEDNTFDLCYSHTVCEHIPHEPFFAEQYRVLKSGGKMSVLSVRSCLGIKYDFCSEMSEEERKLTEKLWKSAGNFDKEHNIGAYEIPDEHDYPKEVEKAGFRDIDVNIFTIMDYAPDNSLISDEMAIKQIECTKVHSLASIQKALNISPKALKESEVEQLFNLINERYDKRIKKYEMGEKVWDFTTTTLLAVSGKK